MSSTSLLPIATGRRTALHLGRMLRARPFSLALTVVVLICASALALLVPALLGRIVDVVTTGRGPADIVPIGLAILASAALAAGAAFGGALLLSRLAQRIIAELRDGVFAAAMRRSASDLERAGTGDLVARVSSDVQAVTSIVAGVLPGALSAFFTIALTLAGVAAIDWRFAVAFAIAAPIQLVALRRFLRHSAPIYRDERGAEAARGQRVLESVRGSSTVRSLQREREHRDAVELASTTAIGFTLRATRIRTVFYGRLNVAELVGLSAVLCTGFWLVGIDAVTLGAATTAALYFHNLFGPIGAMLSSVDDLQAAGASLARLVGVLETGDRADEGSDPAGPRSGAVVLDAVTFGYTADELVLDRVDLTIDPGTRVAVVGATGAGKTTLAGLIAGTLLPTGGSVVLDGVPTTALTGGGLRRRVALVSQEAHLFMGTVRDNLMLLPGGGIDDERMRGAIHSAGADWVHDLPDGLDTLVGDDAAPLDVRRVQHLALVRAAMSPAPTIVLDEATAEAGSADAEVMERAADEATRGRTSVVVAHRLSQARSADRVLVMEHGRIVEDGGHDALVARGGHYARLWAAWAAGREERPDD